jgi:hypothetical protein
VQKHASDRGYELRNPQRFQQLATHGAQVIFQRIAANNVDPYHPNILRVISEAEYHSKRFVDGMIAGATTSAYPLFAALRAPQHVEVTTVPGTLRWSWVFFIIAIFFGILSLMTVVGTEENNAEYLARLTREIVGELPEERRRRQDARDAFIREQKEKALTVARSHSDTLVVTCFEEAKLKKNVAALSASGKIQIFGRVLTNVLETRTRMITIQPITLSVATDMLT